MSKYWEGFKIIVLKLVRDTISESLSDFLLKSQIPVEALWSLRSIHLRVIALHPSFVNLRMPQNTSIVPLTSEPIRVNVFSFVTYKRGNSQYPEQKLSRAEIVNAQMVMGPFPKVLRNSEFLKSDNSKKLAQSPSFLYNCEFLDFSINSSLLTIWLL